MTVSAIGSHSASGSISANTASQSLRLRAAKTASIGALIARCRSDIDQSIHCARTERRAARPMAARELPRFARVAASAYLNRGLRQVMGGEWLRGSGFEPLVPRMPGLIWVLGP